MTKHWITVASSLACAALLWKADSLSLPFELFGRTHLRGNLMLKFSVQLIFPELFNKFIIRSPLRPHQELMIKLTFKGSMLVW